MEKVRVGIIGIGNMGSAHARNLIAGKVPGAVLAAVCDLRRKIGLGERGIGRKVQRFAAPEELFRAKVIDAVMICTQHYDHPPLAIQAFDNGLHVLTEKPAGVYTKQVREMNEAAAKSGKVFLYYVQPKDKPCIRKQRS